MGGCGRWGRSQRNPLSGESPVGGTVILVYRYAIIGFCCHRCQTSKIQWLSVLEIEAFWFFISWWQITLNTSRCEMSSVSAWLDSLCITTHLSGVHWLQSNWPLYGQCRLGRPSNSSSNSSATSNQHPQRLMNKVHYKFLLQPWSLCTKRNVLMKPLKSWSLVFTVDPHHRD